MYLWKKLKHMKSLSVVFKLKNIVRIITLTLLSIYLSYCSYHFIVNEINPTYLDCGKVVSKSSTDTPIRRGVTTELYLNIHFEKSGFQSVNCSPTTYFSKQIGDNVCFNLNENLSFWYRINTFIGAIVLVILGIIILTLFLLYLIED